MARPIRSLTALKFLAIGRLLLVISPSQETNMTHPKHLNFNRFGYSYIIFAGTGSL